MSRLLEGARRERYRAIRDRFFVAAIHGLRRVIGLLGVRRAGALGGVLGGFAQQFLRQPRDIARAQLAEALPERTAVEREGILNKMFRGHGRSMVEIILMDRIAADLDFWVESEGMEILDQALARGRGVIAITGHIGNWELLAAYLGLNGYPLTAIATPVKGAALNQESVDLRLRVNVETVQRDGPGAARGILRTLRAGRILAIVMDQDTQGKGVIVPFFNRPAYTPVGPAALAWRSHAELVGMFIHRGADGRHRLKIVAPQLPERQGTDPEARSEWQRATTAELTRLIEVEVRARPDEWVWWHRRWQCGAEVAP
ncbi:MAG: lysophospholipid acyltransferase family protein [Deltaproteobacteria bacterium]